MHDSYFRRFKDMGCSKRIGSLLLVVMLFFSVTAFVCANEATSKENKKSFFSDSTSFQDNKLNTQTSDGIGDVLRRMLLAVFIVIFLGVAAMVASRKFLPKISHAQSKKIKVLETIHLGSRKTIHLLDIGDQQILIGSTPDRITKLADIFSEKGFPLSRPERGTEKNEVMG